MKSAHSNVLTDAFIQELKPNNLDGNSCDDGITWTLIIPEHIKVDEDFKNRCFQVLAGLPAHISVVSGAGTYPFPTGWDQATTISYAYDHKNRPTRLLGEYPVVEILPSPLLVRINLDEISQFGTFEQLRSEINLRLRAGTVFAHVSCKLHFGSSKFVAKYAAKHQEVRHLYANRYVAPKSIAILTRTLGNRPDLLLKNMQSVHSFAERSEGLEVSHLILHPPGFSINYKSDRLTTAPFDFEQSKSRIKALVFGLEKINADYVLILDDDDQIAAENSGIIGQILYFDSNPRLWIFDSAHVHNLHENTENYKYGFVYRARAARPSLGGGNRVPICSVIYPVQETKTAFENFVSSLPEVLEDHFIFTAVSNSSGLEPVFVDRLVSRISIRGSNQTVTNPGQLRSSDSIHAVRSQLFAGSSLASERTLELINSIETKGGSPIGLILLRAPLILIRASSWRTAFSMGIWRRLFSGETTISEILMRL